MIFFSHDTPLFHFFMPLLSLRRVVIYDAASPLRRRFSPPIRRRRCCLYAAIAFF